MLLRHHRTPRSLRGAEGAPASVARRRGSSALGLPAILTLAVLTAIGGFLARISGHAAAKPATTTEGSHQCRFAGHRGRLAEGPWGSIRWNRIVLTPPDEAVPAPGRPQRKTRPGSCVRTPVSDVKI